MYLIPDPFAVVYKNMCMSLARESEVEVRGFKTKEITGMMFRVDPMHPLADRPQFSTEFALTETLQVITGRGDLGQLTKLAPRFKSMAPSYVTYGPRIAWQLKLVAEKLKADPTSRQCLVQIHTPDDLYKKYPETPCTLSIQFLARDGKLHAIATMRSNDIWFGTPTDVFMFTFFQRHLAGVLGLKVGSYQHQAGSLHVYEEHYDKLDLVGTQVRPSPLVNTNLTWDELVEQAHMWLDFRRGDRESAGSWQGEIWTNYLS